MLNVFKLFLLFVLLQALGSVFIQSSSAQVSGEELAKLVGETSQKVFEIQRSREIARQYGYSLALYGGTSRELLSLVKDKIKELGGVKQYREWLSKQRRVYLLDWHKTSSDIDLMLIAGKETKIAPETLFSILEDIFPGNIFYSSIDFTEPIEFFEKFSPSKEHLEPISNIPITENGVVRLPQLKIKINGKDHHLVDEGLSQYEKEVLDFSIAEDFQKNIKLFNDTYGNFRQVLRWIRYIVENPNFKVTAKSRESIRFLMQHLTRNSEEKNKLLAMLKEGHEEMLTHKKSISIKGKLIEALEKLQLYSRDSLLVETLLAEYGVSDLLREAGIAISRLLKPLKERSKADLDEIESLKASDKLVTLEMERGKQSDYRFVHRGPLAAVQNIAQGALFKSDNKVIINGQITGSRLTEATTHEGALYVSTEYGAISYGHVYVTFKLNPKAVKGVDYLSDGNYFAILTRDAILEIEKVTRESLVESFKQQLRQETSIVSQYDKTYVLRGLAKIIYPFHDQVELDEFSEVFGLAQQVDLTHEFVESFLVMEGHVERIKNLYNKDQLPTKIQEALDLYFETVLRDRSNKIDFRTKRRALELGVDLYGDIFSKKNRAQLEKLIASTQGKSEQKDLAQYLFVKLKASGRVLSFVENEEFDKEFRKEFFAIALHDKEFRKEYLAKGKKDMHLFNYVEKIIVLRRIVHAEKIKGSEKVSLWKKLKLGIQTICRNISLKRCLKLSSRDTDLFKDFIFTPDSHVDLGDVYEIFSKQTGFNVANLSLLSIEERAELFEYFQTQKIETPEIKKLIEETIDEILSLQELNRFQLEARGYELINLMFRFPYIDEMEIFDRLNEHPSKYWIMKYFRESRPYPWEFIHWQVIRLFQDDKFIQRTQLMEFLSKTNLSGEHPLRESVLKDLLRLLASYDDFKLLENHNEIVKVMDSLSNIELEDKNIAHLFAMHRKLNKYRNYLRGSVRGYKDEERESITDSLDRRLRNLGFEDSVRVVEYVLEHPEEFEYLYLEDLDFYPPEHIAKRRRESKLSAEFWKSFEVVLNKGNKKQNLYMIERLNESEWGEATEGAVLSAMKTIADLPDYLSRRPALWRLLSGVQNLSVMTKFLQAPNLDERRRSELASNIFDIFSEQYSVRHFEEDRFKNLVSLWKICSPQCDYHFFQTLRNQKIDWSDPEVEAYALKLAKDVKSIERSAYDYRSEIEILILLINGIGQKARKKLPPSIVDRLVSPEALEVYQKEKERSKASRVLLEMDKWGRSTTKVLLQQLQDPPGEREKDVIEYLIQAKQIPSAIQDKFLDYLKILPTKSYRFKSLQNRVNETKGWISFRKLAARINRGEILAKDFYPVLDHELEATWSKKLVSKIEKEILFEEEIPYGLLNVFAKKTSVWSDSFKTKALKLLQSKEKRDRDRGEEILVRLPDWPLEVLDLAVEFFLSPHPSGSWSMSEENHLGYRLLKSRARLSLETWKGLLARPMERSIKLVLEVQKEISDELRERFFEILLKRDYKNQGEQRELQIHRVIIEREDILSSEQLAQVFESLKLKEKSDKLFEVESIRMMILERILKDQSLSLSQFQNVIAHFKEHNGSKEFLTRLEKILMSEGSGPSYDERLMAFIEQTDSRERVREIYEKIDNKTGLERRFEFLRPKDEVMAGPQVDSEAESLDEQIETKAPGISPQRSKARTWAMDCFKAVLEWVR